MQSFNFDDGDRVRIVVLWRNAPLSSLTDISRKPMSRSIAIRTCQDNIKIDSIPGL